MYQSNKCLFITSLGCGSNVKCSYIPLLALENGQISFSKKRLAVTTLLIFCFKLVSIGKKCKLNSSAKLSLFGSKLHQDWKQVGDKKTKGFLVEKANII